jgi:hypothetical protein
MECNICGARENLVKVKNEEGDVIHLCEACYGTQYEGYKKDDAAELEENLDEDWEEGKEKEEDLLEDLEEEDLEEEGEV